MKDAGRTSAQDGSDATPPLDEEALAWAIRMSRGEIDDFDAFTLWLEAEPERSRDYDRAASALRDAEAVVAASPDAGAGATASAALPVGAAGPPRTSTRWSRWAGGAVAAGLVAALAIGMGQDTSRTLRIETAAGQRRLVALADGSSVLLGAATRIELDDADVRNASLVRGEALFRVRHDSERPFRVRVGTVGLTDLGTVFDVKAAGPVVRVAVSEGAVVLDPSGAKVRLSAGQAAVIEGTSVRRRAVAIADVGAWREGRLTYEAASLEEVASDLSRHTGVRVAASPALTGRTFTGTLLAPTLVGRPALVGDLLGVRVEFGSGGWTLEPRR